MLANIISLVSGCVTFLGGFLVVWGAVSLGLAIREQQGGSQIASAISTIAGGAIIIAAAVYFGMLDTSWLPAWEGGEPCRFRSPFRRTSANTRRRSSGSFPSAPLCA